MPSEEFSPSVTRGWVLDCALGRSVGLAVVLLCAHGVALCAVFLAQPGGWWAPLVAVSIVASLSHSLATHAWRVAPWAIVRIRIAADGACQLVTRRGTRIEGQIRGDSVVWAHCAIVRLDVGALVARGVVVPMDAAAAQDHRRLRVRLRWGVPARARGAAETSTGTS